MKFRTEPSTRSEGKVVKLIEAYRGDVKIEIDGIIIGRFDGDTNSFMLYRNWLAYNGITLDVGEE